MGTYYPQIGQGWPQVKAYVAWPIKRTAPAELQLGTTTWDDVEAKFGECGLSHVFLADIFTKKCAEYPVKLDLKLATGLRDGESHTLEGQLFFFEDEILVGQAYYSSHASNHTDFDESLVNQIVKGQTTRDDVLNLLGPTNGTWLSDSDQCNSPTGLLYLYICRRDRLGLHNMNQFYLKWLTVEFADGVVSEYRYREGKSNSALTIDTTNGAPSVEGEAAPVVASDEHPSESTIEVD